MAKKKSTTKKTAAKRAGKSAEKPKAKAAAKKAARPKAGAKRAGAPVITLSHDEIAAKAFAIWQERGYPQGEDDANWKAAEAALAAERSAGGR